MPIPALSSSVMMKRLIGFARVLVPETKELSLEAVKTLWDKRKEKASAGRIRLKTLLRFLQAGPFAFVQVLI